MIWLPGASGAVRFFNRVVKRGVTQPFPAGGLDAVRPPAGRGKRIMATIFRKST